MSHTALGSTVHYANGHCKLPVNDIYSKGTAFILPSASTDMWKEWEGYRRSFLSGSCYSFLSTRKEPGLCGVEQGQRNPLVLPALSCGLACSRSCNGVVWILHRSASIYSSTNIAKGTRSRFLMHSPWYPRWLPNHLIQSGKRSRTTGPGELLKSAHV